VNIALAARIGSGATKRLDMSDLDDRDLAILERLPRDRAALDTYLDNLTDAAWQKLSSALSRVRPIEAYAHASASSGENRWFTERMTIDLLRPIRAGGCSG